MLCHSTTCRSFETGGQLRPTAGGVRLLVFCIGSYVEDVSEIQDRLEARSSYYSCGRGSILLLAGHTLGGLEIRHRRTLRLRMRMTFWGLSISEVLTLWRAGGYVSIYRVRILLLDYHTTEMRLTISARTR
ncbi:uncharacterized protein LOC110702618 isoform X2 [Chenopodium quinoa]|uniref:uncharacterized protein LOC110702618 isoform X2 n=1 Tax=Chenopodium quinoa TaxID=63459 RepID=UPI000B76F6A8|nr:uncharacterized protein LOC110702618 isoform X2 [Chenopodium quinoa]